MRIRLFETQDAKRVLNWITSEKEFQLWSAGDFGRYPIRPEKLITDYMFRISGESFLPLMFGEKGKPVGHLVLRRPTDDEELIRLCFIIVNKKKRGMGYGARMITSAMSFANKELGATKFNLGVFTNNEGALNLYKKLGFEPKELRKGAYDFHGEKWDWQEMFYDPAQKIVNLAMENIVEPAGDLV